MIFRQLFDSETWTYTYLLADKDSGEALLIDPVFEQHLRDLAILRELNLKLVATLDTHVHADHVTGAALLRHATGCQVMLSRASGAGGADRLLDDGDIVEAGSVRLEARALGVLTDKDTDLFCRTGPDLNVCAVRVDGTLLSQIEGFVGITVRF